MRYEEVDPKFRLACGLLYRGERWPKRWRNETNVHIKGYDGTVKSCLGKSVIDLKLGNDCCKEEIFSAIIQGLISCQETLVWH